MKINEIFQSVQGEGKFQGTPVLFIRLSGCTRKCSFCDTNYHSKGSDYTIEQVVELILESYEYNGIKIVVWTGGEPLLQIEEIDGVTKLTKEIPIIHHLETNGDLIMHKEQLADLLYIFSYISISPKELKVAKRIKQYRWTFDEMETDIKIVTDLDKVNIDMLKYATTLMPLTTYNKKKDEQIRKKVWNYCIEHNLHYSARLHVINFGKKRGI